MAKEKRCRAKNWFITENNPTEQSIQRYKELDCEWLLLCKEHQDEEEQTPHIHVAVCFKGKRDQNALKKLFPRANLKVMQGSPQDCKTYMTKEDNEPFEKGQMPKSKHTSSSKKIEWDEIYELAKEGRFEEIRKDVFIRYQKSLKQLYFDNRADSDMNEMDNQELKKHFLWLWGPTGTGKSHTARRIAKELGCDHPYLKGLNKWWDGYDYQKVTIIEEADPKSCEYLTQYFKRWCDKWSFYAEIKGNTIPECRPEYIIVTSNYSMSDCFTNPDDYVPMQRRLTEVKLESRDFHLYWPKTQAELELEKMGNGAAVDPGNTIPGPQDDVTPEEETPALEDLSEAEEPKLKRARVLED